jgi:hypothetical protein
MFDSLTALQAGLKKPGDPVVAVFRVLAQTNFLHGQIQATSLSFSWIVRVNHHHNPGPRGPGSERLFVSVHTKDTPMGSQEEFDADKRNSQGSTGPKTEAEKARARLKALKDGSRARIVRPVLPHENLRELEARVQQWVKDLKPRNAVERELVEHAARLSWILDRADRFESAYLARRVRKARLKLSGRRMERVVNLGRKLLYNAGPRILPTSGLTWDDDPAYFRSQLEGSAEGCRWLLERWTEIVRLIDRRLLWTWADSFKLVRLQGKFPFEAIYDPQLNAIFLAWDVLQEGYGAGFWGECKRCTWTHGPGLQEFTRWREISERPQDKEAAWAVLRAAADEQIERLEELLAMHRGIGDGLADRAAVEASASFERLRRFQSAKSKELRGTLDALLEMKKVKDGTGHGKASNAGGECKIPDAQARWQMATGTWQMAQGT